jgi:hypothetical protein
MAASEIKLPSGGKISLAIRCLGSVLLPKVVDEAGPEAERGKELHAKLEKLFKAKRQIPDGSSVEDRELYSRVQNTIAWSGAPVANESAELGVAVDPSSWACGSYVAHSVPGLRERPSAGAVDVHDTSGKSTPVDLLVADGSDDVAGVRTGLPLVGDSSGDRASWFVAIADLVQQRSSSGFAVYDWKSGAYSEDPKYSWQFLLPAIWLYELAGQPADFSCYCAAVYISKPNDLGFDVQDVEFDAGDVGSAKLRLRDLYNRIQSSDPGRVTLYEGKHCGFCPARHRCPAKVGAFADAMSIATDVVPLDVDVVKASRTLVDDMPQLKKMEINILKEHGGELDLGDGRVAVLTKDYRGKDKVFTKRAKPKRSDAPEDGDRGTETERTPAAEGIRAGW